MAKKSAQGICKLCLQNKSLQRSHYIPKAFYNLCRSPGRNPIVATPLVIDETPKQMWKRLLCRDCEDLFCRHGESYVLDMIYRGTRFSLLERIRLAMPIGRSGTVPMFSGLQIGIKTQKLGYFALSMLWRGAQGPWQTIEGQTTGMSLGQFEEPIRRYLHEDTGWPRDIVVVATACTDMASQEFINLPWLIPPEVSGGNFTRIELLVRGLWFWVMMGEIPKQVAAWCCVNSPQKIIFMRNYEDEMLLVNRHFLETAEDRVSNPRLH